METSGDLALVEFVMEEYGVAQVVLMPSGQRTKVLIPDNAEIQSGKVYSLNLDNSSLIV